MSRNLTAWAVQLVDCECQRLVALVRHVHAGSELSVVERLDDVNPPRDVVDLIFQLGIRFLPCRHLSSPVGSRRGQQQHRGRVEQQRDGQDEQRNHILVSGAEQGREVSDRATSAQRVPRNA
jgi:hypothetical protein